MFELSTQLYLDPFSKCYKKIIIIDKFPNDPILQCIIKIQKKTKLSPFEWNNECECSSPCLFAIKHPERHNDLLCLNEIVDLFGYLTQNGYTIEHKITKLMLKKNKNLICYFSGKES